MDCLKELGINLSEYSSLIDLFNKGSRLKENEMVNILNTLKLGKKLN
jgi:hypothetical protein